MIDLKKIDNKDLAFVKRALTLQEEKEFSDFLKLRKSKIRRTRGIRKAKDISQKDAK